MKRALTIIAIGAALTGCATAPAPGNRVTIARDWLGPDAEGQYTACNQARRGLKPDTYPAYKREHVSVDGTPHTVTYDSRNEVERAASVSGDARFMNACMTDAGYTWSPWIDRYQAAYKACEDLGAASGERKACIDARLTGKDKMP